MQFVRPDFYDAFHCLAGDCRHSCCVGWEIDVDGESLARYRELPGPFGERLRQCIALEPEPHFILTPEERCPLLRGDGLCELILERGEDSLCDICASHPRFYNEFPGRMEAGLGLCCEEAARLLTAGTDHLRFLIEDDREGETEAVPLISLREELFRLLAEDRLPMTARMEKALALLGSPPLPFHARESARFFLTLERMDDSWTALLEALAALPVAPLEPRLSGIRSARITEYLVYRHFAPGPEEDAAQRLLFCFHAAQLLCALEPLSPDALRLFSAEIEYSDENIDSLCAWLGKKIS